MTAGHFWWHRVCAWCGTTRSGYVSNAPRRHREAIDAGALYALRLSEDTESRAITDPGNRPVALRSPEAIWGSLDTPRACASDSIGFRVLFTSCRRLKTKKWWWSAPYKRQIPGPLDFFTKWMWKLSSLLKPSQRFYEWWIRHLRQSATQFS